MDQIVVRDEQGQRQSIRWQRASSQTKDNQNGDVAAAAVEDDGDNDGDPDDDGDTEQQRFQIRLDRGIREGRLASVAISARRTPKAWNPQRASEWFDSRKRLTQSVPRVRLTRGGEDDPIQEFGTVRVVAGEDLVVYPGDLNGLMPLAKSMMPTAPATDDPAMPDLLSDGLLEYQHSGRPWSLDVQVQRPPLRYSARDYAFYNITANGIVVRHEIAVEIESGRSDQIVFTLPQSTPASVDIQGLSGTTVSDQFSELVDDNMEKADIKERKWTVSLAAPAADIAGVVVTYRLPLPPQLRLADDSDRSTSVDGDAEGGRVSVVLPRPRVQQATYQTGIAALESSGELEVDLDQDARRVDVGELVDAEYRVGKRLLGAFSHAGSQGRLLVRLQPRASASIAPAIVQTAGLVSVFSADGDSQHVARYQLLTKVPVLRCRLPKGAKLWTVLVDQTPVLPGRAATTGAMQNDLLINLPNAINGAANAPRDVQLVYSLPVGRLMLDSSLTATAPRLFTAEINWRQSNKQSTSTSDADAVAATNPNPKPRRSTPNADGLEEGEIPVAEFSWHLHIPPGYHAELADGTTVFQSGGKTSATPVERVLAMLYTLGGGVGEFQSPTQSIRSQAIVMMEPEDGRAVYKGVF
ncbi:MAG: hypothetical protein AAFN70_08485, partial [Planctomycetota bacterium]